MYEDDGITRLVAKYGRSLCSAVKEYGLMMMVGDSFNLAIRLHRPTEPLRGTEIRTAIQKPSNTKHSANISTYQRSAVKVPIKIEINIIEQTNQLFMSKMLRDFRFT